MERKHMYIGIASFMAALSLAGCSSPFHHSDVVTPQTTPPPSYKIDVAKEVSCARGKATVVFRGSVTGDTGRLQKLYLVIVDASRAEVERDDVAYQDDFHFVQISKELPAPGQYSYQFFGDFRDESPGAKMLDIPLVLESC